MLLENHYQNAYVTRDIEQALSIFRERYGVQDTRYFQAETEVTTPKGKGIAVNKIAFIWIGKLQYELIEPVSGPVDLYREAVPEQGLRFHHICMRSFDWDATLAEVGRQKLPIVYRGDTSSGLKFIYADARDTLGHYLEFTSVPPAVWTAMGGR
ncbi:MAG: glyoxalase/Bleomycin resistance/Dioxygenase superfamily protein [Hydrocarboniphaga sp.]|uniref:VOC family protein n=1 Tax=Hydrocarboniphaga sp. TaxID=2033016 RepID=UPI00261E51AE|nr:VOC family protein [Hydrocarboniphaga sp.]MDB5968657.1 glyoxalase/Bleomycin resistance/Dioxygenase superfamily protein [Hydrocarboniphaga sp.]